MNFELFKNVDLLNLEESKNCNGGSVNITLEKKIFTPIVFPIPNPDEGGRL